MDEHVLHILLGFAGVGATFAGFSGVVAVFGRRAHGEWLPEDLRKKDVAPRQRKPIGEFVFTGKFGQPADGILKLD